MPINNKPKKCSKLTLIKNVFFGITFIVVASINDNPKIHKDNRAPSSVISHHESSHANHFLANSLINHTRKLTIPIMTHIKSTNNGLRAGEITTLTGHLKVNSNIRNVKISWIVPDDIEIVHGSKNSIITSTETGQDYQFQITVKSNSDINQIIHFLAKTDEGNNHYSNSAQFHTLLNEDLKEAHNALYERSKKYMQDQAYLEQ